MTWMTKHSWVYAGLGGGGVLGAGSLYFIYGQTPWGTACGVLGILCLAFWLIIDSRRVREPGNVAAIQFGVTSFLVVVVGLALFVFVQLLAVQQDTRWDLTSSSRYKVSEQTRNLITGLDVSLNVYGVFRRGSTDQDEFGRFMRGVKATSARVAYEEIDPLLDVAALRRVVPAETDEERSRLSDYGTVVLEAGARRQRMESDFSDEAFANALIKLLSAESHPICWSLGHGERSSEDSVNPHGMGIVVQRLQDQNYEVRMIRVVVDGIPAECEALIVAGPQTDWLEAETAALSEYIEQGGRALLLLDPSVQGAATPVLIETMKSYGLAMDDDLLVEMDRDHLSIGDPGSQLYVYYDSTISVHPIVAMGDASIGVDRVRSVIWVGADGGNVVGQTLVESSNTSWAEKDLELLQSQMPTMDEDERQSRIGLGAVVELTAELEDETASEKGGRLVVFGDSDFASNRLASLLHNGDVFLNAVAWLVGEDDQMGQRAPKDSEFLLVTGVQYSVMLLLSLVFAPLFCFIMAVVTAVRRRRS